MTLPTYCRRCQRNFGYCDCPPCPTCGKDSDKCEGHYVPRTSTPEEKPKPKPAKFYISPRNRCELCAYWHGPASKCHRFPQGVITDNKYHWCGEWQDNGEEDRET